MLDTPGSEKPSPKPVRRDVDHSEFSSFSRVRSTDILIFQDDAAGIEGPEPHHRLFQLQLPIAFDTRDTDDFTGMHRQIDFFQPQVTDGVERREIFYFENDFARCFFGFINP